MSKFFKYLIKPSWSILDVLMFIIITNVFDSYLGAVLFGVWILFVSFLNGLFNKEVKHD